MQQPSFDIPWANIGLFVLVFAMTLLPAATVRAQDVGPSPPTITTTVNVSAGVRNVVGSTVIQTTGAANATNVTGGTLVIDPTLGPIPGPDSITTVNGNALHANGGAINVVAPGLTIQTQGGLGVLANGAASSVTISNGSSINSTGVGDALVAIGGTINATGVVMTAGVATANAHGAIAEGGGTINLHAGTSMTRAGTNSVGIGASGAGSLVNADAIIPVTMNGGGAMGVYLHDGGQARLLAGSTLNMNGTNSVGVTVDNSVMALGSIGRGLTINFNTEATLGGQAGGTGVVAVNGGSIALEDLTVLGPGTAAGVWARPGSSISLTGNSVIEINSLRNATQYTLTSPYLATAIGSAGSTFSVTGATPAAGLRAEGGTITSSGTSVTVTSNSVSAAGAYAGFGGLVDMADNTIVTTGTNTFGIRIDSGRVIGRDSSIATSGGGAAMFINFGPGVIELTDTVVAATGAGTAGLSSLNGTPAALNTVSLSGGSLTSAEAFAIEAQGPLTLTATDGVLISGEQGLLYAADQNGFFPQPTVINLNASGASQLFGDAFAEPLSIANIDLATGSNWTGAAFDVTNVTTDPSSAWMVTDSSVVTQAVTNAGLVSFVPPTGDPTLLASYMTLTTTNYSGDGIIALNTYLGTDGSPSDRLVIDGGTGTGSSGLIIRNTTGPGALTTANGILVVDAINGGTTTPGAFALALPAVAGPYDYTLHRGSLDPTNPDAWYLRSTLIDPPPCAVPFVLGACPIPPPDPPVPPIPHYRPEVSLAVVNPTLGLFYGRSLLDTLHERIGDRVPRPREIETADPVPDTARLKDEIYVPAPPLPAQANEDFGPWGRIIGVHGQHQGDPIGVYGSGPSFDYGLVALQAGIDLYYVQDVDENGDITTDTAGVYGAVGMANADVEHHLLGIGDFPGGTASLNAYSLGGYWTHYDPGGWYLDGVLQGTIYDFTIDSRRGLNAADTGGVGLAASLEGGYPIGMGEGWILEPQAQAIFQSIAIDDFSDEGADIRYSGVQSLTGRIGVRLARTFKDDEQDDSPVTIWGRANLWHEFLGDPTTEFSSATGFIPFTTDIRDTWIEVGLGADIKLDPNSSVYGALNYETSLDGATTALEGKLGLRVAW